MATFVDFSTSESAKYVPADLQTQLIDLYTKVAPGLDAFLPWITSAGSAYTYNRLSDIGAGAVVAADGTITAGTAITSTQIAAPFVSYSGTHSIPNRDLRSAGAQGAANKKDIAIAAGAKQATYSFQAAIVSTLNTFLSANSGQVAANVSGEILASIDAVSAKLYQKQNVFLMGNAYVENQIKAKMRTSGGVTTVELNGQYFLAYDGMPFVRNDFISTVDASPDTNRLYAIVADETSGTVAIEPESGRFTFAEIPVEKGKDAWTALVTLDAVIAIHSVRSVAAVDVPV